MERTRYSFVVPVYNEEQTLPELYGRLCRVLETLDGRSELLFVDDGSTDGSYEMMLEFQKRDPRVCPIRFSRNFGHQVAISAGIDHAQGDAIVIMDADLQDPPEMVPAMLDRWRDGYEIVYAVREQREGEPWLKRFLAARFYRLLRRWSDIDLPVDVGDFRIIDRQVAEVFRLLPERSRYVRAMFSWIGFRQIGVPYVREERFAGEPKYSLRMSLKLAIDGLINFSTAPLRFVLTSGFVIAMMSFLVGLFAFAARLANYYALPGWASLLLAVSFIGGVQLIVLGVLGLYIERIYNEVKSRPLYVVDQPPNIELRLSGLSEPTAVLQNRVQAISAREESPDRVPS
jgi:glycosyltransferase involved in cell wall biosynthesis